jgi:hypothetical protein
VGAEEAAAGVEEEVAEEAVRPAGAAERGRVGAAGQEREAEAGRARGRAGARAAEAVGEAVRWAR